MYKHQVLLFAFVILRPRLFWGDKNTPKQSHLNQNVLEKD